MEQREEKLSRGISALSRRKILRSLVNKELTVKEISQKNKMSVSLASRHLKLLYDLGFLKVRKEFPYKYYSLKISKLKELLEVYEIIVKREKNHELEEENLSAIILEIGGLATYPSMIKPNTNLERLFELAAHEWLHQYLIFYPLGRSIFENNKMTEINETLANIFGKEISKKICKNKLYKIYCENNDKNFTENPFDYNTFMQETRKNVEVLLKNNNIIEAEEYMENRRKELLEKGIFIRKINQAWFAFNGTYADSPTSISPVFSILKNIQENTDNLKNFIEILQNIDSYEELLQINPTNMEKNNYNY